MMVRDLLNSDMATLGQEMRRAIGWWWEELRAMLPDRCYKLGHGSEPVLKFDSTGLEPLDAEVRKSGRATIVVPRGAVLLRQIAVPQLSRRDLEQMMLLNSERYLPLPAGSALIATSVHAGASGNTEKLADLAAMPTVYAQQLVEAIAAAGVQPIAVRVGDSTGRPDSRFDFLPALRAGSLLGPRSTAARNWWVLVGALALLNTACMVWRDRAEVDRLQALVDAQRPSVAIAQRIRATSRAADETIRRSMARRASHDALGTLALVSAAIPDGAWVQRYDWDGVSLRLTGYRTQRADAAAALRRVPGFMSVKSVQTETQAETVAGQPYDLSVEIGRR